MSRDGLQELIPDEIREVLRELPEDSLIFLPLVNLESGHTSVHGFLKMNNPDAWQLMTARNASASWGRRGDVIVFQVFMGDSENSDLEAVQFDYEAVVFAGRARSEFPRIRTLLTRQDYLDVHVLTNDLRFLTSKKIKIADIFTLP